MSSWSSARSSPVPRRPRRSRPASRRGLLLPAEFLRVAEESGLVVPVGSWVMRQACRQIQRLRVEVPGYDNLQVAVNLSARQIGHPYLVDELAKVLADTNVGPDTL